MRHLIFVGAMLGTIIALSSPACANIAGKWRITGRTGGQSFIVDCRFTPRDKQLSGECATVSIGGWAIPGMEPVPISQGSIVGDTVRWNYESRMMGRSFSSSYEGKVKGNAIAGTYGSAMGKGDFTAVRQ